MSLRDRRTADVAVPVRPRTVAKGKSIRPNGAMVAAEPAVSERRALPLRGSPGRHLKLTLTRSRRLELSTGAAELPTICSPSSRDGARGDGIWLSGQIARIGRAKISAHREAKRKCTATRCAEVFALPFWGLRARRGRFVLAPFHTTEKITEEAAGSGRPIFRYKILLSEKRAIRLYEKILCNWIDGPRSIGFHSATCKSRCPLWDLRRSAGLLLPRLLSGLLLRIPLLLRTALLSSLRVLSSVGLSALSSVAPLGLAPNEEGPGDPSVPSYT